MYVLRTSYFVTPFLCESIHAWIEVCVVEDESVCINHGSNCSAAAVGQDAAEKLPFPVKLLHVFLQDHNVQTINRGETIRNVVKYFYVDSFINLKVLCLKRGTFLVCWRIQTMFC